MSRRLLAALAAASALLALPAAAPAASTTLVINEIDYDQPSTDTAEFLEISNISTAPVNLNGSTVELVNGNDGLVYRTIVLPSTDLAAGGRFVICGGTVPGCDLDLPTNQDLIQNGAPDGARIKSGDATLDSVSYEGEMVGVTEGPAGAPTDTGAAAEGISRCQDGSDTDRNNVDFALRPITPGAANSCPPPPLPFGTCGDGEETPIHAIQGDGAATPDPGSEHVIEGVVVGDFQGSAGLNGFFVQEEDSDADANPLTSEGLFVFAPGSAVVDSGDVVRVQGTVGEFNGKTQLGSVSNLAASARPRVRSPNPR